MTLTMKELQEWIDTHYPDEHQFPSTLSYWSNKYEEERGESSRELIEFTEDAVVINIVLERESLNQLRKDWGRVTGCQPPLVGTYKNGFSLFIPWILKEES